MSAAAQPLEIVFQDDAMVAINKPPGLLVHRTAIDRHESRFALQLLRDQRGQRVYTIHRLDKPTSGLLLFGAGSTNTTLQWCADTVPSRALSITRCATKLIAWSAVPMASGRPGTRKRSSSDWPL